MLIMTRQYQYNYADLYNRKSTKTNLISHSINIYTNKKNLNIYKKRVNLVKKDKNEFINKYYISINSSYQSLSNIAQLQISPFQKKFQYTPAIFLHFFHFSKINSPYKIQNNFQSQKKLYTKNNIHQI